MDGDEQNTNVHTTDGFLLVRLDLGKLGARWNKWSGIDTVYVEKRRSYSAPVKGQDQQGRIETEGLGSTLGTITEAGVAGQ